ncbi:MAG TPA: alcohol dehydrogenase catalytic domain-containing protein [Pseudonocardiaceae bacterium]|jgi:2-desacetyl-2-hydroxyethyl bacteriochlorophyllide A dehydrogenase|nr:alcohol dehydrogenase catalytic domain-containing protein [Pseudonocardiaceae bacterium]
MRQAVYTGPGTIAVRDGQIGQPGPGQVRVDVAYTGICGTDLHIFHGDMDARIGGESVIGHEMSGRIAALGPGVTGWSVGDPVTVMPLDWCGECSACVRGNWHVCQRLTFIGIDSPGAMQQSWVVPERTLIRLPDDVSLEHAALVEPTAVAVHDVRRAGVRPGDTALVVGGGPVGLLIAVVARRFGADVVLVETDAYRRTLAERVGFRTLDPNAVDVAAEIDTWTGGAGARIAFEVSGAEAGLATAVDSLAVRGTLCLVAIHVRPRPVDLHRFFWRELSLVGARLYQRDDFEHAVTLIADGVVPAAELISRVDPLPAAAGAFAALSAKGSVMKVLIDCQAG